MRLLFDTQLLLWLSGASFRLTRRARSLLDNGNNEVFFSSVSIWEIGVKRALNKPGFTYEMSAVRTGLLEHGWNELTLTGTQALSLAGLPMLHRDPFDRMLIAQAASDGLTLVTADKTVARYPGRILLV